MKKFAEFLIILFATFFYPVQTYSAEILQINSSRSIEVGDQNRTLSLELFCVDINDNDEQIAINLLKKEFPRGSKVKIKPIGFKETILIAKVFNIDETQGMSELLIERNLAKETCKD